MALRQMASISCVFIVVGLVALARCGPPRSSLEAAVQRCVQEATPPLIVGGIYQHLGKIDTCVNSGLNALAAGSAPGAVSSDIVNCVTGNTFPDPLKSTIDKFIDCVKSRLS